MLDVASNPSDAVEWALARFGDDIFRLAFSYICLLYTSDAADD